jgi:NAD(P)-dependent dehydrogenase (short-subunit alcohol dehydrogenase family)
MPIATFFNRLAILMFMLASPASTLQAQQEGTVLITGANRGIGLALAERFSKAGYQVIGTARSPEKAAALNALGARVEQLDVTDQASVDAMAERLDGVSIDFLVNNAGIKGKDSPDLADLDIENIEWVLNVNTLGPLRVTRALYGNIRQGERKVVANISSMMGSMEMNTWVAAWVTAPANRQ